MRSHFDKNRRKPKDSIPHNSLLAINELIIVFKLDAEMFEPLLRDETQR